MSGYEHKTRKTTRAKIREALGEQNRHNFSLARARLCPLHQSVVDRCEDLLSANSKAMWEHVLNTAVDPNDETGRTLGLWQYEQSIHWKHVQTIVERNKKEPLWIVNRFADDLDEDEIRLDPSVVLANGGWPSQPGCGFVNRHFAGSAIKDKDIDSRVKRLKGGIKSVERLSENKPVRLLPSEEENAKALEQGNERDPEPGDE